MMKLRLIALLVIVVLMGACGRDATETPLPPPVASPTGLPPTATAVVWASTDTPSAPQAATPVPLPSPTPAPPTDTPTPMVYRVAFVLSDDVLNVRERPGFENPKVGSLAPDARDIQITGAGKQVEPSFWVPIEGQGVIGWVNSRFLTGQVEQADFCQDARALALLDALKVAVNDRDGDALAALVHPGRGLRLRQSWWNPEVKLPAEEVFGFFTDPTRHDWGREDGSGLRISGSVQEILVPLMDKDLLGGTELVCGEVVGGGTAGIIRLPAEYEPVNVYTVYRPAPEGGPEQDWGSWAVGIEYWQGLPYLSFLVHYTWEV
jgi:hypothetical protein